MNAEQINKLPVTCYRIARNRDEAVEELREKEY